MFPSFKYFVKVYQLAVHKNVILCSFKACLHICSKNKVLGWKSRYSVTSTQTKSLISLFNLLITVTSVLQLFLSIKFTESK